MKPWAVSFCDATHRLVHCADQHYAAKFVDGHPQVFFTDRSEWTSRTVWAAVCGHVIALDLSKAGLLRRLRSPRLAEHIRDRFRSSEAYWRCP